MKLVLSLIFTCVFCVAALAAEQVPGEYLVKYREHAQLTALNLRATPGVRVLQELPKAHLFKVQVTPALEATALRSLLDGHQPDIEYVAPNLVIRPTYASRTKIQKKQWAVEKVRAEGAWHRAGNLGSRSVIVAVIDSGADYQHEALAPNMIGGRDFIRDTNDPMDPPEEKGGSGHGTHCAGVIGASGLIDGGTIGISPQVSIMPLRFIDTNGLGDTAHAIEAIDYAIDRHAQVISASWGSAATAEEAKPLIEAIKRASDAGVIFVTSSGNHGENTDHFETYPANAKFANTITVTASAEDESRPDFANYGRHKVDIAAPGKAIVSTMPANRYGNKSGTSMAAPLVSGLVAFLKAQNPSLTGEMLRSLIQYTGVKSPVTSACDCRVDAFAATDALLKEKMFISPATTTLKIGESVRFKTVFGQPPYEYAVSDQEVGQITPGGKFTATQPGETTVIVYDSHGRESSTLPIRVMKGRHQD